MGDGVGVAGRNGIFADFVRDERSGGTLGKTRPRLGRSGDRRGKVFDLHAVRVQRKRRGGRAEAVLVVGVAPRLRGRDIDRLRYVRVRDGEIKTVRDAGHRVAVRDGIFADVVDDQRAGIVGLRLVGPLRLPLRGGGHDEIGYRSIIRIERKRDRPGTNAILILRIVPDLFGGDGDGNRAVVERNGGFAGVVRRIVVAGFGGDHAGNREFIVGARGVGEPHDEVCRVRFAGRQVGEFPYRRRGTRPRSVGGFRDGIRERDAPGRRRADVLDGELEPGGIAVAHVLDERRRRRNREFQVGAGCDALGLDEHRRVHMRGGSAVADNDFD